MTETMGEDLPTQAAVQTIMTHRRETAEDHYQIPKKTQQAVIGHAAIAKRLGLKESVPTNFPEDKKPEATQKEAESPCKSGLTEEQLDTIDLLFSQQIASNSALTMTEVKNFMSESAVFVLQVGDTKTVKRVYNRVRYLQKKNFEDRLSEVEDGKDTTFAWVKSVSSAASGPTRRFAWTKKTWRS